MKASQLKAFLFFVLSIIGMFVLPDAARRVLSIEFLPNGMSYLLANRAAYALLIAILAVLLLRGASVRFAISSIVGVAIFIPSLFATATLLIMANPTWRESMWTTGLVMFGELLLFGSIPIGCWFAWRRSNS